ncbi:MAG: hypothetical protein K1X70_09935 [Leptospirales bacterium]|nr:hypothetical protein [Leptospirales bacterium]
MAFFILFLLCIRTWHYMCIDRTMQGTHRYEWLRGAPVAGATNVHAKIAFTVGQSD